MRVRFDARVSFPGRAGLLGSTDVDRFGGMRMKSAITMKQWLPLAGMTCSAFVFNTSEFMPIGLLTDIAASFGLSEAQAGIMISVYAWAVMVLSLPLMMAASRVEFKRLLVAVVAVFSLGQFLSAVAPTYPILILARLVVAAAHAVFWSIASVAASRLVAPQHGSLAVSMVATGTSVAMILGLPLGRAIGLALGWRMTFGLVGVVSFAIAAYLAACFPKMPAGEPFTLRRLPLLLKNPVLMGIYAMTILFASGYYTGYSYIEPFMQQMAGLSPDVITGLLTVFGAAGLAGSALLTRYYDRRRTFFMLASCAGVALPLLVLRPMAGSFGTLALACAVWGLFGTAFSIAYQSEIIRWCDKDDSAVAMSIYSGIFNLGIGIGSALGGVVVSHGAIGSIGCVGGVLALAALVVCLLGVVRPARARGVRTETRASSARKSSDA